jgi:hypothetical protein
MIVLRARSETKKAPQKLRGENRRSAEKSRVKPDGEWSLELLPLLPHDGSPFPHTIPNIPT